MRSVVVIEYLLATIDHQFSTIRNVHCEKFAVGEWAVSGWNDVLQ